MISKVFCLWIEEIAQIVSIRRSGQFRHGDLPALVHSVLPETGLSPSRLEIEIAESVLIGDFSRALSIMRRLKTLGIRIASHALGDRSLR
jgi:EAL domain-containing protein (putative c-di-GMP-specific phosphodiesterase class I)